MKTENITQIETPVTNTNVVTPIVKIKNLSEKAIVIRLSIGRFGTTKKDKRASNDMAANENTTTEYARVTKTLLKCKAMSEVINYGAKMGTEFKKITRPWELDGQGVCKITEYLNVKSKMEAMKREYMDVLVENLVTEYINLKDGDQTKLGNLYNASDYPSVETFRSRFYVKIDVMPIEKTDFRSNALNDAEIESINAEIENRIGNSIKEAQQENLRRIKEKLYHLFERVNAVDSKFHESCLTNSIAAINEAKSLNINDDAGLDKMFDEITESISTLSADTIRVNGDARLAAANATKDALEKINSAMEAFM